MKTDEEKLKEIGEEIKKGRVNTYKLELEWIYSEGGSYILRVYEETHFKDRYSGAPKGLGSNLRFSEPFVGIKKDNLEKAISITNDLLGISVYEIIPCSFGWEHHRDDTNRAYGAVRAI